MTNDPNEIPLEDPHKVTDEDIKWLQAPRYSDIEELDDVEEYYDDGLFLDFDEEFGYDDDPDISDEQMLNGFDNDDVEMRTAVMLKNGMVALLCIRSASQGAAICRVDPREPLPAVQLYDDLDAATNWYARSLETSKRNGWRIAYYGLPLRG